MSKVTRNNLRRHGFSDATWRITERQEAAKRNIARRQTMSQRYRLECEFVLKRPADYVAVCEAIRKHLHAIEAQAAMNIDGIHFRKVEDDR